MLKILIVDDQKTVQALLNDYLENEPSLEIIGFAENGQDALEMVKVHRPDIILMDIEMPVLDGLSATRIIAEQFIQSSVLILTVHDEDTYLNAALQVGAKGYLLKNTPAKELINAIYSAHKGYFQLGPGLLEKYLYKISQLKSDFQEFQELKTIISQQSNLLNQLRSEPKPSNSSSEATTNNAQLQNEIFTLKQKVYYLHSHVDEFKKRVLYLQNLVFLLIFTVTILILIMYFS
ncbi:MAG: response regulator transcription factor [Xenococcaceae cyanobacterium MO_207.B15]|nr:response regulator transcription factor [Xenococcaceae cyanobacterium MO_207.B15]